MRKDVTELYASTSLKLRLPTVGHHLAHAQEAGTEWIVNHGQTRANCRNQAIAQLYSIYSPCNNTKTQFA